MLYFSFKGDLDTQRLVWRKQSLTLKDKIKLYLIRTAVNIFVIAALGGSLYLIFYTNEKMLEVIIFWKAFFSFSE